MTYEHIAGIAAGVIGLLAYPAYVRDMMSRGNVRPNRATWLIWAVVNWIIALSYKSAGAEWSSCINFAFAFGATFLAVYSLFKGEGGLNRFDLGCLGVSVLAIVLWVSTASPLPALALGLATSGIGTIPTIRKLLLRAGDESATAYALWGVGNVISLTVALQTLKVEIVVTPLFFILQCFAVLLLILVTRRKIRLDQPSVACL